MSYIPDPIELMEARVDRLAWEWDQAKKDVPEGWYRCPYCSRIFDYEPIAIDGRPDSPEMCFECLPEDVQRAYGKV